jgi:hypothetical protein
MLNIQKCIKESQASWNRLIDLTTSADRKKDIKKYADECKQAYIQASHMINLDDKDELINSHKIMTGVRELESSFLGNEKWSNFVIRELTCAINKTETVNMYPISLDLAVYNLQHGKIVNCRLVDTLDEDLGLFLKVVDGKLLEAPNLDFGIIWNQCYLNFELCFSAKWFFVNEN